MGRKRTQGAKKAPAALKSAAVAAVLAVILFIAGTLLRMYTDDLGFLDALAAFARDTFSPGR